jgi:hypothetical protein
MGYLMAAKVQFIRLKLVAGKGPFGYTYFMPDAQTIYELRTACHKPGCPVCALVQRAGARYIEGTFNESMLDPSIRQKLVDSMGFCYEHTWQSIDLKLSEALGHAILYQDLIKYINKTIQENGNLPGKQLAAALDRAAACPACQIEEETLERVTDSLAAALKGEDFVDEYRFSGGLCLPHLKRLLPALDNKRQAIVLEHQQARLEGLKTELAEFIRKSDYRFRDEIIGEEGDSYKRAADLVKGKHRAENKKDLK